jgi:hypothetical protein
MDVKTTGLSDFNKMLRRYAIASSKTREEVLDHRGRNLAFALFREFQKVGRVAQKKIKTIPARRMKVRSGNRTQKQEKARRIFAAGYVAAGWIPALQKLAGRGSVKVLNPVKNPQGRVIVNHARGYIEIVNAQNGAVEADEKHAIVDKALKHQERDMAKYLERKQAETNGRVWK